MSDCIADAGEWHREMSDCLTGTGEWHKEVSDCIVGARIRPYRSH